MPHPSKQLRVFVVDDEFVIASTLALILRHTGFDAISFQAPLEALEAARSQAPDLLISDVVMPQFSGIELAIQMQKQCPNCKILLFSGQAATAGLLETAREQGYDFEVLSKPVHPTDLLKKIAEATGEGTASPSVSAVAPSNGNHSARTVKDISVQ
ncbi:MAG: response regulator [Terracidiphilus sp.]|jgi:DNA-binding NtrC family response regulator